MEATPTVEVRRTERGVVVATLSRPERHNALNTRMINELRAVAEGLRVDASARAVVVTGAGEDFCAGYEPAGLGTAAGAGPAPAAGPEWAALVDIAGRAVRAWLALPMPVIAAIGGQVREAGLSLALAADIRVGAYDAVFEPGYARLGVPGADAGAAWLLQGVVGRGIAADLLLTGRRVDAREAMIVGLLSRVVAPERLLDEAVELAQVVAAQPALGIASLKRSLRGSGPVPSMTAAMPPIIPGPPSPAPAQTAGESRAPVSAPDPPRPIRSPSGSRDARAAADYAAFLPH
jgi:enoyl-CoA hydratase